MSTGEGGMVVTDNTDLFEKVKHYAEHGRAATGFEITDIGFKYKMSNIQAALGLAQLERVNELIEKKVQIYEWYSEDLLGVDGVTINKANTDIEKSIYWMTSIVLDRKIEISRDQLILKLRDKNIDSRPFFPRMTSFPMFNDCDNPVAEHISKFGINLPSGHNRTREEISYISSTLKEILNLN